MPTVKNVGEPCAGEPHARIDVAAGGNQCQSATPCGAGASRRPYINSTGLGGDVEAAGGAVDAD
jgi:hypothetical protein